MPQSFAQIGSCMYTPLHPLPPRVYTIFAGSLMLG